MGTRIIVVKLREVIKTSILAIIGLLIIGVLIYLFVPKNNKEQALYNPGTYKAEIVLHNSPVLVEVTVSSDEILNIELLNMNETQEVFYPLFSSSIKDLTAKIISTQETDFYTTTETSTTDSILLKAVDTALSQAKIK